MQGFGQPTQGVLKRFALAALQGKATDGATIRDNLMSVSEGGTKCTTFADCAKLIADGEDVDYDGLSGPISFDENGESEEIPIWSYEVKGGEFVPLEQLA